MAQQDAFALGRSNLNGFLFADIGIEGSGMPLSVISALARQGLDPWQEAGRLAGLPRIAATDGLARLIAAMPASLWPMADATAIAARLVALLPRQHDHSSSADAIFSSTESSDALALPKGTWLFAALLVIAVLVGLAAYVSPAPAGPAATAPALIAPLTPVPTGD